MPVLWCALLVQTAACPDSQDPLASLLSQDVSLYLSRFKIKQAEANSLLASTTPFGRKKNPDARPNYVLAPGLVGLRPSSLCGVFCFVGASRTVGSASTDRLFVL